MSLVIFSLAEAINLGLGTALGVSAESLKRVGEDRRLTRSLKHEFRKFVRANSMLSRSEQRALARTITRKPFIKKVCGDALTAKETALLQRRGPLDGASEVLQAALLTDLRAIVFNVALRTLPTPQRMLWRDIRAIKDHVGEIQHAMSAETELPSVGFASEPGIYLLDDLTLARFATEPGDRIPQLFFRMSSSIESILAAVCSNLVVPSEELMSTAMDLVESDSRVVFIVGDGGTGKSTILTQLAVHRATNGPFANMLIQLTPRTRGSEIFGAVERALASCGENGSLVLFVDNPCQNPDLATELILLPFRQPRLKVVLADRTTRLAAVMADEDLLVEPHYERAFEECRVLRLTLDDKVRPLAWAKVNNTYSFPLAIEQRQRILATMFRALTVSEALDAQTVDQALSTVLPRISDAYSRESISELYLRVAVAYNDRIENSGVSSSRGITFDWDDWIKVFSNSPRAAGPTPTVPLAAAFPIIAALDLFKVPMSLRCLQQITGLSQVELLEIIGDSLANGQPAALGSRDQQWYLSLRHDTIADLYFSIDGHFAQPSLEQAITLLDQETALLFERAVFRRKWLRGQTPPPAGVNVARLLAKYRQEDRLVALPRSNAHTYWLEQASIYAMRDTKPETLSRAWDDLLARVVAAAPTESKSATLNAVISCIYECADLALPLPPTVHEAIEALGYRETCSVLDGLRNSYGATGQPMKPLDDMLGQIYERILAQHPADVPARQISRVSNDFVDILMLPNCTSLG
ncbi:MAG: hypothetical protein QM804_17450 [Propionicimonas sp.]